jgi:hypothetical protein
VDIVVVYHDYDGKTVRRVAPSSFYYWDASFGVDQRVFEPLLLPLAFEGPGAFGTRWVTGNDVAVFTGTLGCDECVINRTVRISNGASPSGRVIWIPRRKAERGARATSSVRELSTGSTVRVPTPSEDDFGRESTISIPVRINSRTLLRLWALKNPGKIGFWLDGGGVFEVEFAHVNGESLWFASADITRLLANAPAGTMIHVNQQVLPWETFPLWSLVSITNNTTQAVELVPDYCQ